MIQGLSILIPTYADNPEPLIESLISNNCNFKFEIIIQIDGLDYEYIHKKWKEKYNFNPLIKIIQSPINKGRAITRNELVSHAQYSHLLFLDADTLPKNIHYLTNYTNHLTDKIICGGNAYLFKWIHIFNLRYRYGKCAEETTAIDRNKKPYQSFSSNNFLIPKTIFNQIQFDSTLKNYGHEDTLFGLQCERLKIPIEHIDNAVYHEGLESNKVFINKSEVALKTLVELQNDNKIIHTKLINTYYKIQNNMFYNILLKVNLPIAPLIKLLLTYTLPSVLLFNFYKLIFYYKLKNEHRNI